MRRKRKNTRNGVLIDLTSLLDVIFILLLVVVCSYNYEKQNSLQAAAEVQESLESAVTDAEANSQIYADMIDTQNNLQKYVWAASIVVPYEPDEITTRHIKILREDAEILSIDLVGNDDAENIEKFKDCLKDYVEKFSDRPVILSLNENDDKILYRDEKKVKEILDELTQNYKNVYIKGNISEE